MQFLDGSPQPPKYLFSNRGKGEDIFDKKNKKNEKVIKFEARVVVLILRMRPLDFAKISPEAVCQFTCNCQS